MAEVVPFESSVILYVGDRVGNALRPVVRAAMESALVHRGLWATIQWHSPGAGELPTFRVESLMELPGCIA